MKKRLIQVGVGGWGASWLDRAVRSPEWDLVAIVGRGERALAQARSQHGIAPERCFTSLTEAAKAFEADAALVVIPSPDHLPLANEAFDSGLHVMIEKPLADTMEDAHKIVRMSKASGKLLMVTQNYRYRPAARRVASLLAQGWLGKIESVSIEYRRAPEFERPPMPHAYKGFRMIEDMTVHHIDQMRGIMRDNPVKVYAQARNPERSWFAEPPLLSAVLEMESGALVHYFASWISRGRQTSWDGLWCIDCENGQIEWADNRVRVRPEEVYYGVELEGYSERDGWMDSDGWLEAAFSMNEKEGRAYMLEEFADCVAKGREPATNGCDNLRSLAPAFAIADSVLDGQPHLVSDYLDPTVFSMPINA